MGRYFDFSPIKPWAGGLGDVFEGISRGVEDRNKRQLQDAELEQKKASTAAFKQQVEAQVKKLNMEEQREARTFEQTQADRDQAAAQRVTGAAAGGRMGEAQAYAAATQRVDPKTGRTLGVTFNPESLGAAPEAPVAPEQPEMLPGTRPDAFVGPVEPPDVAKARAMAEVMGKRTQPPARGSAEELLSEAAGENAYGVSKQIQDQRGQAADNQLQNDINKSTYARQKADYDVQNAAYEPTKAAYDERAAHPNFTVGINGQQVKYNPQEAKNAAADEARQTAAQMRKLATTPGTDPNVAAQILRSADQIEARIPTAAAGAINNTASASQAQGATKALQTEKLTVEERIQDKHDTAKVSAAAMSGGRLSSPAAAGMAELLHMKAMSLGPDGEILDPDINSKIAARAAELGIPPGGKNGWSGPVGEIIRGPAVAARQRRAEEGLEVTDEAGNAVSGRKYKSNAQALAGNKTDVEFARVRERMQGLIDDVKTNGPRVTEPAAIQRRLNRAREVQAALRKYNDLGSTDFSQKLEEEIQGAIGTPGNGFLMGANVDTYQHMLDGATSFHEKARNIRTRSTAPRTPQGIAAGARGQKAPAAVDPKDQALIEQAQQEIAKKGPNAASAQRYLDHLGVR